MSSNILNAIPRTLHLQTDHPLSITRQIIESRFLQPEYKYYNNLSPVVSVAQNFDSLGFPPDHPGRSRTDTYYINRDTVLRTHTSAHQVDSFRANESDGFLISADVYRRDAIDRSHYPIFHQMEGARLWDRFKGITADTIWKDGIKLPILHEHAVDVEDNNPTIIDEANPLQSEHHTLEEVEAISHHLKRMLVGVVEEIFTRAKEAASATGGEDASIKNNNEPLRVRWVPAYFPFTSPSWELEVFWEGEWLELLGSGIIKQELLIDANVPNKMGWAFGIGLERIAMLLFSIPDIRLFWSRDPRFLSQFSSSSSSSPKRINRFVPFSKHPACYQDMAFWLPDTTITTTINSSPAGGDEVQHGAKAAGGAVASTGAEGEGKVKQQKVFHENDFMEIIREVAGDVVEAVTLIDEFTHPCTGRKSRCYRINYRKLERTLTNKEVNLLHQDIEKAVEERLRVEVRH